MHTAPSPTWTFWMPAEILKMYYVQVRQSNSGTGATEQRSINQLGNESSDAMERGSKATSGVPVSRTCQPFTHCPPEPPRFSPPVSSRIFRRPSSIRVGLVNLRLGRRRPWSIDMFEGQTTSLLTLWILSSSRPSDSGGRQCQCQWVALRGTFVQILEVKMRTGRRETHFDE